MSKQEELERLCAEEKQIKEDIALYRDAIEELEHRLSEILKEMDMLMGEVQ